MENTHTSDRVKRRARADWQSLGTHQSGAVVWQTIYSDMMTNLMLFFLMLFALNLVGEIHYKEAAKAFKEAITGEFKEMTDIPVQKQEEQLAQFFKEVENINKDLKIIEYGEGVRLRFPEPILFDSGKAELKPEAEYVLHELAEGLKKLDNVIVVEGHTDNVPVRRGPYRSNWELSVARAESVVNYLIGVEGIKSKRLAVAGYGEFWPFVPNDSDLNRALNRRIEMLVIVDEDDEKDS